LISQFAPEINPEGQDYKIVIFCYHQKLGWTFWKASFAQARANLDLEPKANL
jgi:hypothetical protein